jgi:hypothetical protein
MEKSNLFIFSQNHKNLNQIQEKTQVVLFFTKPQKGSVIDGKDSIIIDFNFHRKNEFNYNT